MIPYKIYPKIIHSNWYSHNSGPCKTNTEFLCRTKIWSIQMSHQTQHYNNQRTSCHEECQNISDEGKTFTIKDIFLGHIREKFILINSFINYLITSNNFSRKHRLGSKCSSSFVNARISSFTNTRLEGNVKNEVCIHIIFKNSSVLTDLFDDHPYNFE